MNYIYSFIHDFVELSNEMAPYLLLGFIIAGLLHVYVKKETITQYLGGKNLKSVLYASLLGIPLPLCSCGVIPTGISFHSNGASKGASVSFLISTPQTGVDSILVTYSLLGLPLAILRPIIALVSGIAGGVLTNWLEYKSAKSQPEIVPNPAQAASPFAGGFTLNVEALETSKQETCNDENCGCHDVDESKNKISQFFKYAFIDFMQDIALWLIIGLGIAAAISVILPKDFFELYIGNNFLSMLIVLAASIPLYVCATGSVPIAAMLLMKGLSPGAAIAFLMAGPATNAATMTVIGKSLGKRTLFAYLASIIGGAIFFGTLIDLIFPETFLLPDLMEHAHEHEVLPRWLHIGSSVILGILAINALLLKYGIYRFPSKKIKTMDSIKISVHGMTCNHCKNSVETNLSKLPNISSVSVDLASQTATIEGSPNLNEVEKKLNELGYEYKGKL